jgi:hypothetical protein
MLGAEFCRGSGAAHMADQRLEGAFTFGLVSFPVRLFSAARSETLSFNQLHKHDNSRIKQVTLLPGGRQAGAAQTRW